MIRPRRGYYYEDDTFSLPSLYISSEELSALLIARNMLQGISASYIRDELSLLTDKITSILKRHIVEEAIIDDAVSIQQVAYVPPPEGISRPCWRVPQEKACRIFILFSGKRSEDRQKGRPLPPVQTIWAHGTLSGTAI